MGSDGFCLRWGDFESNVAASFRQLRTDGDFFDVTLACQEKSGNVKTMQAHRVILSAGSSFFKKLLQQPRNALAVPLVYLKGVRTQHLASILDFLYYGEVSVPQTDLASFLATAEDLQIRGLAKRQMAARNPMDGGHTPDSNRTKGIIVIGGPKPDPLAEALSTSGLVASPSDVEAATTSMVGDSMVVKADDTFPTEMEDDGTGADEDDGEDVEDMDETGYDGQGRLTRGNADATVGVINLRNPNGGKCLKCGKVFSLYSKAKRHYETVHATKDEKVVCHVCKGHYKNAQCLKSHLRVAHDIFQQGKKKI